VLGRWLKKKNSTSDKLTDVDPEVRLEAIVGADNNDPEIAACLAELAANDPELRVRCAAIRTLPASSDFSPLLDDDAVASSTADYMASLVLANKQWDWLGSPMVLDQFLSGGHSKTIDQADMLNVAKSVQTPNQIAELILQSPLSAREQLLSNDLLQTESGLQVLERASRERDKNVNRHARQHLEQCKSLQTSTHQINTRCAEIDTALRGSSDEFVKQKKLIALRTNLAAELASLSSNQFELGLVFELPAPPITLQDIEDREAHLLAPEPLPAKQPEPELGPVEPEVPIASIASIARGPTAEARLETSFWQSTAKISEINQDQPLHRQINQHKKLISKLNKEIDQLAWPSDQPEPEKLSHTRQSVLQLNDTLAGKTKELKGIEDRLETLLEALEADLGDGKTLEVGGRMKIARDLLLETGSNSDKAKDGERKIAALSAQLTELRDWQKYATDPKRESLLTELKALADQPQAPPTQAARLKSLRTEWQQLGRPSSRVAHEQQEQFDQLAKQAFEPCKAYFQEQEQIRQSNLTNRINLCGQLETYLAETDWRHADYKAADQIMRAAREEWRRNHPCERKLLKPVEQNFEALQNRLHEHLKSHWDANVAAKQSIVDTARALTDGEDVRQQVEQAKRLQQEWKNIGATPRSVDQRLWKEFRTACDAVFTNRNDAFVQEKEEQSKNLAGLNAAVEELEKAAQVALEQTIATNQELRTLNQAIETLLPSLQGNRAASPINDRWRKARLVYEKALAVAAHEKTLNEVNQLEEQDASLEQAESKNPNLYDLSLRLALESELSADQPSPSSDQAQRMALQIEFMNAGIRDLTARDYRELVSRWQELGPKTPAEAELRKRFFNAISKRLA
jgi:hypothetical protein